MQGTLEAQYDLRQEHNTSKYLKLPNFHNCEHWPMSAKITNQKKKKKRN